MTDNAALIAEARGRADNLSDAGAQWRRDVDLLERLADALESQQGNTIMDVFVYEMPVEDTRVMLDGETGELRVESMLPSVIGPRYRQVGSPVPVDMPLVELNETYCLQIINRAFEEALND